MVQTLINSRDKGRRGEIELAKELMKYGYEDSERTGQFCGKSGDADVRGVPYLHIECKRVEQLNIEKALQQAEEDHKKNTIPVVMHRKNREQWKVTLRLDAFMNLWKLIPEYQKLEVAKILWAKQ